MPQCPQCNKTFAQLPRKCPTCMAELDLLVDYVSQLQIGLEQAERFTRTGDLGKAVWAYLSVLEIDPDNPIARRQVGQVVTAVRQFDRTAPGRRWLMQLRGEKSTDEREKSLLNWVWAGAFSILVILVFAVAYMIGYFNPSEEGTERVPPPPGVEKPQMMGN